jgi:uncharacterized membrane protein YgcG
MWDVMCALGRCKQINRRYTSAMPSMKCPACATPLAAPAAECPKCKFTLRRLDTKFGAVPLHSRYLTDHASSLTVEEITRLRELLQRFETRFPQSLFSVFVADLPEGDNVKEYAFWLSNRAQFSSVEAAGSENFDLLLVLEPSAGSAALNVGYGLEKYISEDDLADALTEALPDFQEGQFESGIRTCVEAITRRLRDVCRAAVDKTGSRDSPTGPEEW